MARVEGVDCIANHTSRRDGSVVHRFAMWSTNWFMCRSQSSDGHFTVEVGQLAGNRNQVLSIEFADDHVLVGEELVQGADRHLGALRDLFTGERFEPHLDQQLARRRQQRVEFALAALLRRPLARHQLLRVVLQFQRRVRTALR